jgi:hypothetical protein
MLSGGMVVSCGSDPGLEGDISAGKMGSFISREQHIHLNITGEIFFRPLKDCCDPIA